MRPEKQGTLRITSKKTGTIDAQTIEILKEFGLKHTGIDVETKLDIEVAVDGTEKEQNEHILEAIRKIQRAFPEKGVVAFHTTEPATAHRVSPGNRCDD